MATRILFDPRQDLPDGTTSSAAVVVEATPTAIRTDGAVVIFPTTQRFTVSSAADPIVLTAPGAGQAWRLVVRRGSSHLEQRTVTWTAADEVAWADLTDLDPATLEPTPDVSASWTAAQELAQAAKDAVDALKAGAPGALDTFLELATELQADESGAAALAALVGTKAPLASPALTGTPTVPTVAGSTDSSTKAASTAFVQAVAAALGTSVAATYLPLPVGTASTGSVPTKQADGSIAYLVPVSTGGTSVVDNGDGTFTASGSAVTDNGDGTFTIAA